MCDLWDYMSDIFDNVHETNEPEESPVNFSSNGFIFLGAEGGKERSGIRCCIALRTVERHNRDQPWDLRLRQIVVSQI